MVSLPLGWRKQEVKGCTALPMTSAGLFEVGIYGLAALDIHRPAETTW